MVNNEPQQQSFDVTEQVAAVMTEVMTDLSMLTIGKIEKTLADLTFEKDSFKEDNSKTLYYTGLPSYKTLYFLEQLTAPFLFRQNASCSTFQQLVLTFMKLRFNSDMRDLGHRFVYNKIQIISTYFKLKIQLYTNPVFEYYSGFIIWIIIKIGQLFIEH